MANIDREKDFKGDCFSAVFNVAYEDDEVTIVHGWVFSPNLQKWIVHAWCELEEIVIDLTIQKELLRKKDYYELLKIREEGIKRYSKLDLLVTGFKQNHHGPWDEDLFPENDKDTPPWLRSGGEK